MTPNQKRLFDMLAEVVDICEREGIVYYAAGGTALGAMRHGGFIPWDDDVDLMMPRDDWKRFVEVARAGGLPEGRVLNCHELDVDYPHVFGRYTDMTSCAIHYNQMLGGTPEGFVIDIFVLDPVPDGGSSYQEHREALSLYNDLSNELGYSYPMSGDLRQLRRYSARMRREGRGPVLRELAAQLERHEGRDCDYLVMRWAAAPRLFAKQIFSYERFEPFEGLSLRVPGECNDYLVQHYGDDWMYLPPDAQRAVHDAITFLDVDYKTVQADYLPFLDVPRVRRAMLNRRAYHIRFGNEMRAADDLKARICASFALKVTSERAHAFGTDLEEALAARRFADLDGVFAEFYRWQTSPLLEGREEYLHIRRYHDPVYVGLDDGALGVAVENLVHTNRLGVAGRILRVRELAAGPVGGRALQAKRLLEAVRLPASLLDAGCEREAFELSEWLLARYPQNFSNRLFYMELLRRRGDWERLASCAREGLAFFPASGEYAKYEADCLWEAAADDAGRRASFDAYEHALARTTHAGIARDVHSKVLAHPDLASERLSALLGADGARSGRVQAVPGRASDADAAALGDRALDLLREAVQACERAGVECWAGPVTCACASARARVADGRDNGADQAPLPAVLDLLVPAGRMGDAFRAVQAAAQARCARDRAIDCWNTNGHYLSFQIDYVDKATTLLDLDEGTNLSAHGAKARIVPVRAVAAGGHAARASRLEEGWEANGYRLTKKVSRARMAAAAEARAFMALGRKRAARKLFDGLDECFGLASSPEGDVELRSSDGVLARVEARFFTGRGEIDLAGAKLPAPIGVDMLLEQLDGAGWPGVGAHPAAIGRDALASSLVPYEALLDDLQGRGLPPRRLFLLMRRVRLRMVPMAPDLRIRARAMRIAARSEERKRIYDDLRPHDVRIARALEEHDFERLAPLLADYERAALRYLGQNLGLCPCKFHLEALCSLWRHAGRHNEADKLERLAPKEHYRGLGER